MKNVKVYFVIGVLSLGAWGDGQTLAFHAVVGRAVLSQFVAAPFQRTRPVDEWQFGAHVLGTSQTDGTIDLRPVKNSERAEFRLSASGDVRTSSNAFAEQATVCTVSDTRFVSEIPLWLDDEGFQSGMVSTWADTQNSIVGISVSTPFPFRGIARRAAWNRASHNLPEAAARATRRVIAQVNQDFPVAAEQTLKNLGSGAGLGVPQTLKDLIDGLRLRFQTNDGYLGVTGFDPSREELVPRPPAFSGAPRLGLAIHQGLLNQWGQLLAGLAVPAEGMVLTFQEENPVAITFEANEVRILLSVIEVKVDQDTYAVESVSVRYRLTPGGPWGVHFARASGVEIKMTEAAETATVLKVRFEALFPVEWDLAKLFPRLGPYRQGQNSIDDGWLVVGLN
ncbi:MAG: hypothetical protein HYR96_03965 [Deltaproteobacteria bacterium]|nr:hypothetical protein [Deltaproteobacteria bacterium]MBI3294536.1 hypothetical protein [Deltaproteobacteria bacterium]